MPNVIKFTRKGETKPVDFRKLDTELWDQFDGGEPEDNDKWCRNWYNIIGLSVALGRTADQVVAMCEGSELEEIACYIRDHFDVTAYYSPNK